MSVETQGLSIEDAQMVATLAKSTPMLRELKPRKDMFGTEDAMYLTALGAMIETRMEVEAKREAMFAKTYGWADDEINGYDEVIIGGGPTAAAYAAARVLSGKPRPLVITDTLGGRAFGKSMDGKPPAPWFRLNSSNRPGELGLSSEESALNVIPGSPIQGAMLNMDRYQDNTVHAFITRTVLMRHADLRKGTVTRVVRANSLRAWAVELEDGGKVYADRVLDARGLGQPTKLRSRASSKDIEFSERVMSVYDFADRFCQPFPFRDMHRVAVIGSGDTSKVVIEALLGTGPSRHMSVPMLDWVEQIDWYGNNLPSDCFAWREQERTRYQDIGSFLRRPDDGRIRLRVFEESRATADEGLGKAYVSGRSYDAVIVAIGFKAPSMSDLFPDAAGNTATTYVFANDSLTKLGMKYDGKELYQIGAAANLSFDNGDPESTRRIDNNQVAMFRNLPRVVQLAIKLPMVQDIEPVTSAQALRTTRKVVGTGFSGVKIRLGDKVKYLDASGIERARGTVVKNRRRGNAFAIKQDAGYRFSLEERLEISSAEVGFVEIIEPKLPRRQVKEPTTSKVLGYDQDGEQLREGDRVTYTDYDSDEINGVVVRDDTVDYLAVKRDGYDTDDEESYVSLDEDEYNSVRKDG